jgi:hypothetical protein
MVVKKFKNGTVFHRPKLSDVVGTPLDLNSLDKKSGLSAWGILALGIIVYDIYAIKSEKIETLTRSFWRITEKPKIGNIFIGVWLGLTFHLLIEKLIRKAYNSKL